MCPGRSGSLTVLEGDAVYDDLVLTAQCMVENMERYEEIASYLKGSGRVTFANRPEGYYEARIVNQIPFEKILRGNPHRSFAVNFRCKPFWYVDTVPAITVTQSGSFVTNPGNVYAEPVITVYGSGTITLMVGLMIIELEFRHDGHEQRHERRLPYPSARRKCDLMGGKREQGGRGAALAVFVERNVLQFAIQSGIMPLKGGADMASKSANVMARVEPEIKAQAEAVLDQLGLPVSVVINSLYRQIIMNNGLPFSLTIPSKLPVRDQMSAAQFDAIMEKGLTQAQAGNGMDLDEAFEQITLKK